MGHTHLTKVVQAPDYTYVNCGTALDSASAIEFNGMDFKIVRY